MMVKILNQYEHEGMLTTEYTKDGINISHVVKSPAISEPEPTVYQPTNIELAQMISDLQVDLIIAGVI